MKPNCHFKENTMQEFSVDIDLGLSGFNFYVKAHNLDEAIIAAHWGLKDRGISPEECESIKVNPC
jgi:hypothetical protein